MEEPSDFGEGTGVAALLADLRHMIGNGCTADGGQVSAASFLIVRELRLIRHALEGIGDTADALSWDVGLLGEKMREGDE